MYSIDLRGKYGLVFGIANHRSIAWGIAQMLHDAGATLALTYQDDRVRTRVTKLAEEWGDVTLLECDVSNDENIAAVFDEVSQRFGALSFIIHSIAFANREDLEGDFSNTSRQ